MVVFEDIEDVQDWLDPLGYAAFWSAVGPWAIFSDEDRDHCDSTVARGIAPEETVLACMKAIAQITLIERFGLGPRFYEPVDAQYLARVH